MNTFNALGIQEANAICYSGFRDGQHPGGLEPSYEQIKEDLQILQKNWKYLRIYDCDSHGQKILEVIDKEGMDFQVMMGAYIIAEMNNFGCPWGGVHSEEVLKNNHRINENKISKLIELANQYPDIIFSVSVGNEACVDWTDHYVSVGRVIEFARQVKRNTPTPVTFCENYIPWAGKLKPLAEVLDFISIHTYPVWEYKHIHESIGYTKENYQSIADIYPDIPVVITEAGWSTNSNGRGIDPYHVSEENQKTYFEDLNKWIDDDKVLCFVFEAFDENWKGSPDPMEPEKHWGLFYANRKPKLVMQDLYSDILV